MTSEPRAVVYGVVLVSRVDIGRPIGVGEDKVGSVPCYRETSGRWWVSDGIARVLGQNVGGGVLLKLTGRVRLLSQDAAISHSPGSVVFDSGNTVLVGGVELLQRFGLVVFETPLVHSGNGVVSPRPVFDHEMVGGFIVALVVAVSLVLVGGGVAEKGASVSVESALSGVAARAGHLAGDVVGSRTFAVKLLWGARPQFVLSGTGVEFDLVCNGAPDATRLVPRAASGLEAMDHVHRGIATVLDGLCPRALPARFDVVSAAMPLIACDQLSVGGGRGSERGITQCCYWEFAIGDIVCFVFVTPEPVSTTGSLCLVIGTPSA